MDPSVMRMCGLVSLALALITSVLSLTMCVPAFFATRSSAWLWALVALSAVSFLGALTGKACMSLGDASEKRAEMNDAQMNETV